MRRTDDRADAREAALPDDLLAELVHQAGKVLPQRASVGEDKVLHVRPALVRGLEHAEEPRPVPPCGREERLERVAPEVEVDRERVCQRRLVAARFEIGRGVGPCRRTDVTALRVREHEQAGRARVVADFLEGTDPVRPERLEERELRLHADDVRRDRVDDPAAEARDVAAKLDGQQIRVRIEPDNELRSFALDLGGQAVGERQRGHGHSLEQ